MAGVTEAEFKQVQKFMKEVAFTHTDDWLVACMNWIKENNSSVTLDVFKREIAEQWKDANLQEMESSCLPVNLAGQKLAKLTGRYGLQVNCMRDIGESAYSQWTKLKKLDNENSTVAATDSNEFKQTWQPTPKRCLFLTMTDGSQVVQGMEMQPLSGLSLTMKPGFKVIISGPVDCRRGIMHLKPGNVKIIGGEVEDLLETNRMEKILADALKLLPGAEKTLPSTQQFTRSSTRTVNTQLPISTSSFTPADEVFGDFPDSEDPFPEIADDDDLFMELDEEALIQSADMKKTAPTTSTTTVQAPSRGVSQMTTQAANSSSMQSTFTEEIEDFDDEVCTTTLPVAKTKPIAPITKPISRKPVFVPPTKPVSASTSSSSVEKRPTIQTEFKSAKSTLPVATSSNGSAPAKQLNIMQFMKPMPVTIDPPTPERQAKRRRKSAEEGEMPTKPNPTLPPPIKEETPDFDDFDMMVGTPDDSLFKIVDETLESKLRENGLSSQPQALSSTKASTITYPVTVPEAPFVYLAQVKNQIAEFVKQRKVVHVKACVSTVVSNISIDSGCWTLGVSLNDGTDYLNCKISSSILSQIIGFTPAEMKRIKSSKSPGAKQQIAEGMQNLTSQLVHTNAVFAIEIGDTPMITDIIDLKLHHAAALKSRLFKIGL